MNLRPNVGMDRSIPGTRIEAVSLTKRVMYRLDIVRALGYNNLIVKL
jgi:hypothetical protein